MPLSNGMPDTIFIQNKYTNLYFRIIAHAKKNNYALPSDKIEEHHIIPDSFFVESTRGSKIGWLNGDPNDNQNLVFLSMRQHILCHYLLTKMTIGSARESMVFAYNMMTNFKKYSSRSYEKTKKEARKIQSARMSGENHPCYGKKQSKETINKRISNTDPEKLKTRRGLSPAIKDKTYEQYFGEARGKEIRKKISVSSMGHKKPDGFNQGKKNPAYGKIGKLNPRYGKVPWNKGIKGITLSEESLYKLKLSKLAKNLFAWIEAANMIKSGFTPKQIAKKLRLRKAGVQKIADGTHVILEYLRRRDAK